jgi:hypothetical protein
MEHLDLVGIVGQKQPQAAPMTAIARGRVLREEHRCHDCPGDRGDDGLAAARAEIAQ